MNVRMGSPLYIDCICMWVKTQFMVLLTVCSTKAKENKLEGDWEQYRKLRNLVTCEFRKAKRPYFEKVSEYSRKDPKKIWKEVA